MCRTGGCWMPELKYLGIRSSYHAHDHGCRGHDCGNALLLHRDFGSVRFHGCDRDHDRVHGYGRDAPAQRNWEHWQQHLPMLEWTSLQRKRRVTIIWIEESGKQMVFLHQQCKWIIPAKWIIPSQVLSVPRNLREPEVNASWAQWRLGGMSDTNKLCTKFLSSLPRQEKSYSHLPFTGSGFTTRCIASQMSIPVTSQVLSTETNAPRTSTLWNLHKYHLWPTLQRFVKSKNLSALFALMSWPIHHRSNSLQRFVKSAKSVWLVCPNVLANPPQKRTVVEAPMWYIARFQKTAEGYVVESRVAWWVSCSWRAHKQQSWVQALDFCIMSGEWL